MTELITDCLSPEIYGLYGRATGHLQKDSCQYMLPKTAASSVPFPLAGPCQPIPLQKTLKYSQADLAQSLVRLLLLSPGFCLCPTRVAVFPSLWTFCNQILLSFKVRFPGDSQSLCQIPRLGSLFWGLEPLQVLWYYCSPVCGLHTWRIWDLILS